MKIKNKVADLKLDNLLGVIIAVIGITIIFGIIILVYTRWTYDAEFESAKSSINIIEAKINALEEGEYGAFTIRGVNSEDYWFLTAWGKNDILKPDRCALDSCICICKGDHWVYEYVKENNELMREFCQDSQTGICRTLDVENIEVQHYYFGKNYDEVRSIIGGDIAYNENGENEKRVAVNILLPKQLLVLEVDKQRDKITLINFDRDVERIFGGGGEFGDGGGGSDF